WATHRRAPLLIDRETIGERLDPFLDRSFHQRRLTVLRLRDRAQDFGDHAADLLELRNAETARGRGRRAEPQARGDERLLGIERDAVLVAGDGGTDQRLLGDVALQPLRAKIYQHQMVVGTTGDD